MIYTDGAIERMKAYGLNTTKVEKYKIIPKAMYAALLHNRLNKITLRDLNTLCDILCCRPEDVLKYDYVEWGEGAAVETEERAVETRRRKQAGAEGD